MIIPPSIEEDAACLVMNLQARCADLSRRPSSELTELQHRAEDLLHHERFSIRTAAEITRAACILILEERATSNE